MVIKGFVLKDKAGILPIVPAAHKEGLGQQLTWEYIRNNTVLQTIYAEAGEDLCDFILRVNEAAEAMSKRPEYQRLN